MQSIKEIKLCKDYPAYMEVSSSGNIIAVSNADGLIEIYKIIRENFIKFMEVKIDDKDSMIYKIIFSKDDKKMAYVLYNEYLPNTYYIYEVNLLLRTVILKFKLNRLKKILYNDVGNLVYMISGTTRKYEAIFSNLENLNDIIYDAKGVILYLIHPNFIAKMINFVKEKINFDSMNTIYYETNGYFVISYKQHVLIIDRNLDVIEKFIINDNFISPNIRCMGKVNSLIYTDGEKIHEILFGNLESLNNLRNLNYINYINRNSYVENVKSQYRVSYNPIFTKSTKLNSKIIKIILENNGRNKLIIQTEDNIIITTPPYLTY